jgi:hypothetical protein
MKELLDKITSYNLFNYLLPGIVFVFLAKEFTDYDLVQDKEIIGAFLYYFIGMVISRIGSLIFEPFLKWIKVIKLADYKDFIIASKADAKIELLSEANNTYRTLASMSFLLITTKCYNILQTSYSIPKDGLNNSQPDGVGS